MIINDIEYAIRFWIDDEADETILDEVFGTLEEMNEFIEKIWHNPQYEDLIAKFSPVEVINGEPEEAVRYIYDDIEVCGASAGSHFKGAHQTRNREMVDRSDLIVCCIERENGGAWQTVRYAMGHGKTILNLAKDDESVHL